jgi:hypothetical protein
MHGHMNVKEKRISLQTHSTLVCASQRLKPPTSCRTSFCTFKICWVSVRHNSVSATSPKWQTWRSVQCTRSYVSMDQCFSTGSTRTISGTRSCLVISQIRCVASLWKATISFVMSVCPRGKTRLQHGLIFVTFDISILFEKLYRQFKFH